MQRREQSEGFHVSVSRSVRKGWCAQVHGGQGHAQLGGVRVTVQEGQRFETMWSQGVRVTSS